MNNTKPAFSASIAGLKQRLSDGESPQDLLEEVVDLIINNAPIDAPNRTTASKTYADCITLLADHGACVAPADPEGCALQTLIRNTESKAHGLIVRVVSHLGDKPGELPFHILAKEFPIEVWNVFISSHKSHTSMLALDHLGRNVSHYLWDQDGMISRDHQAMLDEESPMAKFRNKLKWSNSVHNVWKMQEFLQDQGIGMDVPDKQGRTAMDLCLDRVNAGDAVIDSELDVCLQVKAQQIARNMDNQTAPASAKQSGLRF